MKQRKSAKSASSAFYQSPITNNCMTILTNTDNSFNSYQRIIDFYHEHKGKSFMVIELKLEQWFSANMCSALGGILDLFSDNLNDIRIDASQSPKVQNILLKNEFLSYYGFSRKEDTYNTTIKYLQLKPTDGKYFKNYVVNELIGRNELPRMSRGVKTKMAESIYEIFVNAQQHSGSKKIYTCGQFFPNKNSIEFTISDIGLGFKKKINNRFRTNLAAAKTIQWATQDRNTTKKEITGGIGLALLKEFIRMNNGKLQIISDDGFYQYENGQEQLLQFSDSYPGTIVNLQFNTNDRLSYILKTEISNDNIF